MLSGHLCRCTGYAPIVDAIEDTRRQCFSRREKHLNLAQSLLAACERHPEREAFPGIRYGELLPRVRTDRRRARGRAGRPGRGRPRQPARDGAPLLGGAVGRRGARAALVAAVRGGARLLHRRLRRGPRDPRRRPAARRAGAPGRARPRRARDLAPALHVGHDRAARRACRARTPPTAPAAWSQALQHGYASGDRTLGVMPLYHTMGIHSLLAMHLVGGCFVPQARWDAERGAAPDRGAADHLAVPRADPVPRPRPLTSASPTHDVSTRAGARLRGGGDDLDDRRPLPRGVRARGVRQPLRLDRGLHVLDRPRPGGQARLRRAARRQHAPEARAGTARSACTSRATRRSPATGTGRTPTRRRFATAGTTPATPATSTPTATSGSTGGSTT